MNKKLLYMLPALALLPACSDDSSDETGGGTGDGGTTVSVNKTVTIDATQTYQTIVGFGASDCWSPAYVGKYWTSNREDIARLLFSKEMNGSQPEGIGLSMWRVNLGGGTMAQGDASGLEDASRRADSYLNDDLTYDWNRCEGQRYFMQQAKEMGCDNFVLFSNTPPVQYTRNGKGYSASGGNSNLKDECYDDFANYMATVAAHYASQGYNISHISPVNEPQYNWDGGQEGSGWTNDEVARLARHLDAALTTQGLSTNILLGEAGDWEYLYRIKSDANRSDVLSAFFTPSSSAYVGNLDHVSPLICAHSYWTDGSWEGMRNVRQQVASAAERHGVEVWQSEWSMLGDGYSSTEFGSYDNATTMDIALYMSRVIHNDLTVAGVTSWCYWTSMDVTRWGHKNRFLLISLLPSGWQGDQANVVLDGGGSYEATPTLWVLGNYSRFVLPGYRRISLQANESLNFFGSAWMSPDGKQIVAVYTNYSDKGVSLIETRTGWGSDVASITTYTTTQHKELSPKTYRATDTVVLDAESVTTVVYTLK